MFRILVLAFRNNWESHKANRVNLLMGTFGMIFNNALFISGFYMMIFAGRAANRQYIPLFFATQIISMLAWGSLNFFVGGFRELGALIESGEFESFLASPRSSLFLAGISRTDVTAFGDVLFGLAGIPFVAYLVNPAFAVHLFFASLIATLAMLATFIASGALAFFVNRGAALGEFINFLTLSLSSYPTTAALEGRSRLLLFLTPALATAFLPLQALLEASVANYCIAIAVAVAFFFASLKFFERGVKNFRSTNYIYLRT